MAHLDDTSPEAQAKDTYTHDGRSDVSSLDKVSPGVARIEAISSHMSTVDRVFIYFGVFLIAYAYGLDGTLRYTYQPYATSSFAQHSLLATINVVRAVVAAAAQPTAAKIADMFGRLELVIASVFFYVIGTIVEATCHNVQGFAAGAFLYQVGYTCIILLVEVIVADTTSLRSRVIYSYIPATPFLINTWVSGDVSAAVLKATTWRWGVGMWCIIYTVCSLPLIFSLWRVGHKAKRAGTLASFRTPLQTYGWKNFLAALFWQLDVIGIILLIMIFGFILVPFTIAGGASEQWRTAKIIAPLVIGILSVPAWILWERRAPHPMVPFHLLKDRAVWAGLGIAITLNFAWTCQGDFLFSILTIGFNESTKSATRISSLYSFCSVLSGLFVGFVILRVRHLKPFILFGTCLFMVAFGILIHYRGGTARQAHSGIIGGQILLGIAGGFFPYPTQAAVQAATKHEHVAVITGLYLASYNIGSALGNTVSGAIWTQVVPGEINKRIANQTEAALWYGSPLEQIVLFPPGTQERDAVIDVYRYVQRLLCITGICLCVVLIGFACLLRNPRLGDQQSLPNAEGGGAPEVLEGQQSRTRGVRFWKK